MVWKNCCLCFGKPAVGCLQFWQGFSLYLSKVGGSLGLPLSIKTGCHEIANSAESDIKHQIINQNGKT